MNRRVILCGGVDSGGDEAGADQPPVQLMLWDRGGGKRNVTLKITDITDRMAANLPARFVDLLEIATYVYCADQATTRGGKGIRDYGANWRREFQFRIPVREPDFWRAAKVVDLLRETLGFLSEDQYDFTFLKLQKPPAVNAYLDFGPGGATGFKAEEVLLFSGGAGLAGRCRTRSSIRESGRRLREPSLQSQGRESAAGSRSRPLA